MEIPEINMISDFEAGMKCLQNPSLISRFSSFPGIEKVPRVYSFWKWGALIFAIFATFSSIVRRIKLVLIRFCTVNKPCLNQDEEVIDFNEDDEISLASSDDDGEDEQEEEREENDETASFRGRNRVDEDFFCVKGATRFFRNGGLRRRRSSGSGAWSEFAPGRSVVNLWESLGLSLDFDEDLFSCDARSVVSTWDEFSGGIWNAPPTVMLTAEGNRKGDGVILGGYDTRMRRCVPALYAEWKSSAAAAEEKVAAGGGGVGMVYVSDGAGGVVTVGDVRNVRRPLETVRESDGDTWWDADAVIVEDEF